jgi:hypothetical protein
MKRVLFLFVLSERLYLFVTSCIISNLIRRVLDNNFATKTLPMDRLNIFRAVCCKYGRLHAAIAYH